MAMTLRSTWTAISCRRGRDDGDRVDQALVEHPEDDVDDEERCGDEDRGAPQRCSESVGIAVRRRLAAVGEIEGP